MASAVEGVAPYVNPEGLKYYQLFQQYPSIEFLYFDFEKHFSAPPFLAFAREYYMMPIVICIAYVVLCFGGQYLLKDKKPFDLRYPLAYWNLFLSAFSFLGMIRTVPHILHNLTHMPFNDTICLSAQYAYGNGACGLWVMLFIFSKIPELFDTFFIVVRKRPLIFLHWYHHITVLLFCWHSYATESSTGLYFVAMNYTVHAIMYGYYFLMAMKIKCPFPPGIITLCQISQMFIGTFICISSYYLMSKGQDCAVKMENVVAGGLMYFSYFVLFVQFALERYIFKGNKGNKGKTE